MLLIVEPKRDRVTCAECGVIRQRADEDAYGASQRHIDEGRCLDKGPQDRSARARAG